ncbi:MAG: prefoldin subunit alpha [Methanosarcinales archaeon]
MKEPDQISEQELRNLAAIHQQYQYQAESLVQQINLVQMSISGCENAIKAIDAMKEYEEDKDILVSIGYGSFIHAKPTKPDKVLIGIGAGISAEKNLDDAKQSLTERKNELNKVLEKMNLDLGKLTKEIQNIQAIVAKYAEKKEE